MIIQKSEITNVN